MAAARTLRAALLGLNVASAIRFSKKNGPPNQGEEVGVDMVHAASCAAVPDFVTNAVRGVANTMLAEVLPGLDPQGINLKNIGKEFDLSSQCSLGVDMNTSLHMTGFGASEVSTLECASAECVEGGGLLGCRKSRFDFATRVSTPELLNMYGKAFADWSLCGIANWTRETTIGALTRDPGVSATLQVDFTWSFPPQAKIVGLKDVSGDLGSLERFECGFDKLPNFIGSKLEKFCETIGEWLVEQVGKHLLPLIQRILDRLTGSALPLEEYQ